MRELRLNQFCDVHAFPFVRDKQVLAGRQRLYPLSEAADEVFRLGRERLPRNGLNHGKHILGPMVDLAQEQLGMLLMPLAFRDVAEDHSEQLLRANLKLGD